MLTIQTQCPHCNESIFLKIPAYLEFDLCEEQEFESDDSISALCTNCNAEIEFNIILSQIQNYI